MMTAFDACHLLPDPEDKLLHHHFENQRVFSPLPAVHVSLHCSLARKKLTFNFNEGRWNVPCITDDRLLEYDSSHGTSM